MNLTKDTDSLKEVMENFKPFVNDRSDHNEKDVIVIESNE